MCWSRPVGTPLRLTDSSGGAGHVQVHPLPRRPLLANLVQEVASHQQHVQVLGDGYGACMTGRPGRAVDDAHSPLDAPKTRLDTHVADARYGRMFSALGTDQAIR